MITPKGKYAHTAPSILTYRPFLLLGLLSASVVIAVSVLRRDNIPESQIVFSIINVIFMLTICMVDIGLRFRTVKPQLAVIKQYWLKPVFATLTLTFVLGAAIIASTSQLEQQRALAENSPPVIQAAVPKPANNDMTTDELIKQISLVDTYPEGIPKLGMYNQSLDLPRNTRPYIQHSFTDWRDEHYFALAVAKSLQAGNTPLITIEPRGEAKGDKLLNNIASGVYDERLDSLARVLAESKNPIYIRFGHEMELADLYPWGNQKPELYKKAYRYTVKYLREKGGDHLRFVWSPAGNMGAEAYYPGDAYVDVIGTTILYDEHWYGSVLPQFSNLAFRRQWLQEYGKPVWIVEFGAGRANKINQKMLIKEAIRDYDRLGYEALVYLNLIDANIVGPDYTLDSINDFGPFFTAPATNK